MQFGQFVPTLSPAAAAGPTILIVGQPVLTGVDALLKKILPQSVSPWTTSVCKGASFGLGVASIAAAVSASITLLPAIGVGLGVGAVLGIGAKLLAHFYTSTSLGQKLAAQVTKIPGYIKTPVRWIAKIGMWLIGGPEGMTSAGATAQTSRSLFMAMNMSSTPGKVATVLLMLSATGKINRVGKQKSRWISTLGAGAVAGAALAAPIVLSTTLGITPISIATRIAVGTGAVLMGMGLFAGIRAFASFAKDMADGIQEAAEEAADEEPVPPTEPTAPAAPAAAEPVAEPVVEQPVEEPVVVDATTPLKKATKAKAKVFTEEELVDIAARLSATMTVNGGTPVPMSADVYSAALDRMVADGMTVEQAVEALKAPAKQSRTQRRTATARKAG